MKQKRICIFGLQELRLSVPKWATTDKQMCSSSSYQKPIERSGHFHRLAIIYPTRFSLCHEAKKALHDRSTRDAVVSFKAMQLLTSRWVRVLRTKANRALRSLPSPWYYVLRRFSLCHVAKKALHDRFLKSSMVARLQKETTRVDIFRTKGTAVFRTLPSSFYHVFDALELIILLPCIAVWLQS